MRDKKQQGVIDFVAFLEQNYSQKNKTGESHNLEKNSQSMANSLEGQLIYYEEPYEPVILMRIHIFNQFRKILLDELIMRKLAHILILFLQTIRTKELNIVLIYPNNNLKILVSAVQFLLRPWFQNPLSAD